MRVASHDWRIARSRPSRPPIPRRSAQPSRRRQAGNVKTTARENLAHDRRDRSEMPASTPTGNHACIQLVGSRVLDVESANCVVPEKTNCQYCFIDLVASQFISERWILRHAQVLRLLRRFWHNNARLIYYSKIVHQLKPLLKKIMKALR